MNHKSNHNHDVRVMILLLACAGVVVTGCLALNGFMWARLQKTSIEQNAAFDQLAQYATVLSRLQDIELGQRAYRVTGDEGHLEVFISSVRLFEEEWEKLVELETTNGRHDAELAALNQASWNLIQNNKEIVSSAHRPSRSDLKTTFAQADEEGEEYRMTRVRTLYRSKINALEKKIRDGSFRAEDDFQAGLATSIVMGGLALALGWIAVSLLRRVLKEIDRSERYALSMLKSEESRRQKDVFLAMMSHEIRTPLNAIIGFGEMAEREEMGPKGKRYVKSILEGGKSMLILINDILDLSKLQAGKMELERVPTNLREMLRFLKRLFKESCHKKGVSFLLEVQDDLPEVMVIDSARLRQVLMNLVGNAVKCTDHGTVSVKVHGYRQAEASDLWGLVIEVRDTGRGISKQNLAHVFEPFYQSKSAEGGCNQGTGLGLSIVQQFVKLMEGALSVDSKIGQGTCFTIEFRNVSASAKKPIAGTSSEQEINLDALRSARILAVDDNETNRELIREIFSDSHHEVMTADDGEQAVRKVGDHSPDVILMDLRMPVKDGSTAAREIKHGRELHGEIPIIAVSAGSLSSEDDECFDGSLKKPFTRQELYQVLAEFLPQVLPVDDAFAVDQVDDYEEVITLELVVKLEGILADTWVDAKSEMLVSKVIGFTEALQELAASTKCERLRKYVSKLRNATDNYSFSQMESELGHFPDLVLELKETLNLSDV